MLSAPKDLRDKIVAPESAAAEAMLAAGTASALRLHRSPCRVEGAT